VFLDPSICDKRVNAGMPSGAFAGCLCLIVFFRFTVSVRSRALLRFCWCAVLRGFVFCRRFVLVVARRSSQCSTVFCIRGLYQSEVPRCFGGSVGVSAERWHDLPGGAILILVKELRALP